ncbi:hypothetical protein [Pseudonocardia pini]|uniref:hypothetical protein n=1 Tax=Pseudonocardia pini TaxID=2758030 RepID=UPI0015F0A9EE|nr:hypothetical protein [Pseudonocardia pini]
MTTLPTSGSSPGTTGESPTDPLPRVAQNEAATVGQTAADASRQVAGAAAEQAAQVGQEARSQAKDLLAQARRQATDQARSGQQKAGESLQALAFELHEMATAGERPGPVSDLAEQAAGRLESASRWLSEREPGDLVDEVRGLARRRPGAFLIGAAAAGLLVGRLTRGAIDANRDTNSPTAPGSTTAPAPATTPPPAPEPYADPYGGAPPRTAHDPGRPAPTPPAAQWTDTGRVPSHAPRPGATTVGEYVEELERRAEHPYPGDPR